MFQTCFKPIKALDSVKEILNFELWGQVGGLRRLGGLGRVRLMGRLGRL